MAKVYYRYNVEACKYEPIVISPKVFWRQSVRFLSISFLLGVVGLIFFDLHYPSLDEKQLEAENQNLKTEWSVLDKKLMRASNQLAQLEAKDDHNYRVILDLEPLSIEQREAGVGGRQKSSADIAYPMIRKELEKAEKIKNRIDIEIQSMQELQAELIKKEKKWASRPAIQPVSNKDLTHLHTTFGMRFHPIFLMWRDHKGLDFTAPKGSPVYATGDGTASYAQFSPSYGNVVFIDHGYQFETRYAHLTNYIVSPGQNVKRGQVVGYVGNTGVSVSPHLHYEVFFNGTAINPINFFQRDLSNKEYEKLIEQGRKKSMSLD
jgi:Membrane proteins related to metalloendopeptidases